MRDCCFNPPGDLHTQDRTLFKRARRIKCSTQFGWGSGQIIWSKHIQSGKPRAVLNLLRSSTLLEFQQSSCIRSERVLSKGDGRRRTGSDRRAFVSPAQGFCSTWNSETSAAVLGRLIDQMSHHQINKRSSVGARPSSAAPVEQKPATVYTGGVEVTTLKTGRRPLRQHCH